MEFPDVPPPQRLPTFFPVVPPPLDMPVPRTPESHAVYTRSAPAEMADYPCDFFYPQLASRLYLNDLGNKRRTALDHYHATKLSLLNELRTELDHQRDAPPAERLAALDELARKQAPALAALETEAEQLRADFEHGSYEWSQAREWRLGHSTTSNFTRGDSPREVATVMRASAYYQDGLLIQQRGLLREIALDVLNGSTSPDEAARAQSALFFQPSPARIRLPDNLPAGLSAKIADYQNRQDALKKELYDFVYREDNVLVGLIRNSAARGLAEKQASRLLAQEALAEDIRRDLARLPGKSIYRQTDPLPAALMARVATYVDARIALQNDAIQKVREVARTTHGRGIPVAVDYDFDRTGRLITRTSIAGARFTRARPEDIEQAEKSARTQLDQIEADFTAQYDALERDRIAMLRDIATTLSTTQVKEISDAFNNAQRLSLLRDSEDGRLAYREAVVDPGLSAAQRRLLFDDAVAHLGLPSPRLEMQPGPRSESW